MKQVILFTAVILAVISLCSCSGESSVTVKHTYEQTPIELISDYNEASKETVILTYSEMSDGTYTADGHTYKYKLELEGRGHNAACDSVYTVLSNKDDITFERVERSYYGSHTDDFFDPNETVVVAIMLK